MRKLLTILIASMYLTGCATTGYVVNGVEPKKEDSTLKTVGLVVGAGLLLYAISPNKGKEACKSYVSGPYGGQATQTITTYKDKC